MKISTRQAAVILGVNRSVVLHLVRTGKLKAEPIAPDSPSVSGRKAVCVEEADIIRLRDQRAAEESDRLRKKLEAERRRALRVERRRGREVALPGPAVNAPLDVVPGQPLTAEDTSAALRKKIKTLTEVTVTLSQQVATLTAAMGRATASIEGLWQVMLLAEPHLQKLVEWAEPTTKTGGAA